MTSLTLVRLIKARPQIFFDADNRIGNDRCFRKPVTSVLFHDRRRSIGPFGHRNKKRRDRLRIALRRKYG
jgi:hypothetical protein